MAIIDIINLIVLMMVINNIVLAEGMGISCVVSCSKRNAAKIGLITTFAIIIVSSITYYLEIYIVTPLELEHIKLFAYVLIMFFTFKLLEIITKKIAPKVYGSINCDFRIVAGNSAVLGVALSLHQESITYIQTLFASIGVGIGFIFAMMLFASVRKVIDASPFVPESFKGVPIQLIALSIISLVILSVGNVITIIISSYASIA